MTTRHPYGPHRPEDAPNAVTVLSPPVHSCGRTMGHAPDCELIRFPQPETRPIPAGLVKQRADLNELARKLGAGEGTMHQCEAKGRDVWVPGVYCPLCRKVVATDG